MTQPKYATETASGRFYAVPGYENLTFISVTNAIGCMAKHQLAAATAKRAGVRAVEQEMMWHAIQQEEYDKLISRKRNPLDPKQAKEGADEKARLWISAAMREYADYASMLGSAVHFCCEHYEEHVDVVEDEAIFDSWLIEYIVEHWATKMSDYQYTVDRNVEQIRKHVTQYAAAIREKGIAFIDRERTVCSPEHGYAGTLDGVVTLEGALRRYVLDLKTGGLYNQQLPLQLSSYRYATHEVHGDRTLKRDYSIDGGLVLQLKPQSYSLHEVQCDDPVFQRFLQTLGISKWMNEECKDAVGEGL